MHDFSVYTGHVVVVIKTSLSLVLLQSAVISLLAHTIQHNPGPVCVTVILNLEINGWRSHDGSVCAYDSCRPNWRQLYGNIQRKSYNNCDT